MFDTHAEIPIEPRLADGSKTKFVLRWPSDQEWCERARLRKILVKRTGRGSSTNEVVPDPANEVKLIEAITTEGGAKLSHGEATYMLNLLAKCDILNCELGADDATVTMRVWGGEVVHTLNQPTAEQQIEFQRGASKSRELPFNVGDIRVMLEAAGKLWDACHGKSADYANGIPILHKDGAIRAVIAEIDRQLQPGDDEDDFS